jgi:hypothetical protein
LTQLHCLTLFRLRKACGKTNDSLHILRPSDTNDEEDLASESSYTDTLTRALTRVLAEIRCFAAIWYLVGHSISVPNIRSAKHLDFTGPLFICIEVLLEPSDAHQAQLTLRKTKAGYQAKSFSSAKVSSAKVYKGERGPSKGSSAFQPEFHQRIYGASLHRH